MDAQEEEKKTLYLANWGERIVAWIIDLIIIGGASAVFWFFLHHFFPVARWDWPRRGNFPPYSIIFLLTPFWLFSPWSIGGGSGIFLFLYWAVTEGLWGQSLGKRLLGLKVVDLKGNRVGFSKSIIESLGKALLLPLDIIISLVIPEGQEKRQRLFNYLSGTIVIRTREKSPAPQVEYVKT